MSVNYDKHSVERRHNQRFLGIFLMFVVVAAVIGLFIAFSTVSQMTGHNIFTQLFGGAPQSATAGTGINAISGGSSLPVGTVVLLNNGTNGSTINCTDTDGGVEPYIFGIVRSEGKVYSDFCWKNGTNVTAGTDKVAEFYCWNNIAKRRLIYCPGGCADGACLNIAEAATREFIDNSPGATVDMTVSKCWCNDPRGSCSYAGCGSNSLCYTSMGPSGSQTQHYCQYYTVQI